MPGVVGRGGGGYAGRGAPAHRAPGAPGTCRGRGWRGRAVGWCAAGGCTMRGCDTAGRFAGVSGRAGCGGLPGSSMRSRMRRRHEAAGGGWRVRLRRRRG